MASKTVIRPILDRICANGVKHRTINFTTFEEALELQFYASINVKPEGGGGGGDLGHMWGI